MKPRTPAEMRDPTGTRGRLLVAFVILGAHAPPCVLLTLYCMNAARHAPGNETSGPARAPYRFSEARQQAAEFIAHDRSITLSPEQQAIMKQGLSSIPAPCCSQFSIATCCCPCNLARSTWGLAKLLITRERADSTRVAAVATEWLRFSNPHGYTGDACFQGGCERPFELNGCGGMHENHVL